MGELLDLHNATLVGFSMAGAKSRAMWHGTVRVAQAVLMSSVTPSLKKSDDNPDGIGRRHLRCFLLILLQQQGGATTAWSTVGATGAARDLVAPRPSP
jgi:hypothetical protein